MIVWLSQTANYNANSKDGKPQAKKRLRESVCRKRPEALIEQVADGLAFVDSVDSLTQ